MKVLASLILTATLAAVAPAQTPASTSTQPDLQIISSRFDSGIRRTSPFAQETQTDRDGRILNVQDPANDGPPDQFKTTVLVKNTGAKTVKSINWSVVQFDLNGQREIKRSNVRTKKQVAPGETETLTTWSPPVKRSGTVGLRAEIDRVEYSDGTVWQR